MCQGISIGERTVFSTNDNGTTGYCRAGGGGGGQEMDEHLPLPNILQKIKLTWNIELNVKDRTIKFTEENTGEKFHN